MGYWTGKKHSEETKKKIRESMKGKNTWKKGVKLSEDHKRKISLAFKGKKRPELSGSICHFWKGGITSENDKLRHSLELRLWRKAVFGRDKYQCIWGGKEHGNKLNADHIKPFALFPELRFAIDNGRTLCVDCHRKTETYGRFPKKGAIIN